MKLSIPASGDDQALIWSNADTNLMVQSTNRGDRPAAGVYFLTVDHNDDEAGAEPPLRLALKR